MEELDFSFFFCRVAHFYSITYRDMLDLPLKVFWTYSRNIDRIRAQSDARQLTLTQFAQATPEGVTKYREALVIEAGTVVRTAGDAPIAAPNDDPLKAERDDAGFSDLRRMAGQTIGTKI